MEMHFASDDSNPPTDDGFIDADTVTAISTDELACQVCGIALTYGGRGRKPKFCADHKPIKGTTQARGTNIDTLIGQMEEMYAALGAATTFLPPVAADGMIIATHAHSMAESWRPLIQRDPKIRKFWEKMTTGGGWGTVIMAHGVVALAIMQVHNVSLPGMGKRQDINQ
jgi:hypothetical protein